ncbi:MAG: hypothetical protein HQM11_19440 [SAR324 cluster bacterium]|nr:hypothetical protein [SAR324 cluster bacterium]
MTKWIRWGLFYSLTAIIAIVICVRRDSSEFPRNVPLESSHSDAFSMEALPVFPENILTEQTPATTEEPVPEKEIIPEIHETRDEIAYNYLRPETGYYPAAPTRRKQNNWKSTGIFTFEQLAENSQQTWPSSANSKQDDPVDETLPLDYLSRETNFEQDMPAHAAQKKVRTRSETETHEQAEAPLPAPAVLKDLLGFDVGPLANSKDKTEDSQTSVDLPYSWMFDKYVKWYLSIPYVARFEDRFSLDTAVKLVGTVDFNVADEVPVLGRGNRYFMTVSSRLAGDNDLVWSDSSGNRVMEAKFGFLSGKNDMELGITIPTYSNRYGYSSQNEFMINFTYKLK